MPDALLLFEPPSPKEQARRFSKMGKTLDRFEKAEDDFHKRVAVSFSQMANFLANNSPTAGIHVVTIAQAPTPEEVHSNVCNALREFCQQRRFVSPV